MKKILRLFACGFVTAFFALAAQAANLAPGAYSVGSVEGDVSYKLAGSSEYKPLTPGTALPQGVTIKTGDKSTAYIVFASGAIAAVEANSEIEVTKFEQETFAGPVTLDAEPAVSNTELKVVNGSVTSKVSKLKKGSSYTVNSPVGAAGVRGTLFRVSFDIATGVYKVEVSEGGVEWTDISGNNPSVPVNNGQQLQSNGNGVWEISDLPPAAAGRINGIINRYLGRTGQLRPGSTPPTITVDVTQGGIPVSPK